MTEKFLHCRSFNPGNVAMKQLSAEGNEEWVVTVDVRGKLYYRTGHFMLLILLTINIIIIQHYV